MNATKTIERFGGLIKEEPLASLQDDILLHNTTVLESITPFFGYYNYEPHALKPQYLYCPLNGYFSFETITRATQSIRQSFQGPFDAATGTITMHGISSQVIRIRNLENYKHISTLQQLYLEEGISFSKRWRKVEEEMGMIKLRKFFFLEHVSEDIFIDKSQDHHAYFIVPEQIDWDKFKVLTDRVKYDTDSYYFDGAIAFLYHLGEIRDMIRIYRENFTLEEIDTIKSKYLTLLTS